MCLPGLYDLARRGEQAKVNRLIGALIAGLMAMGLVLLAPSSARGAGFAMGPTTLEIADAVRGGEYQDTVFVKYTNGSSAVVQLSTTGDISGWVSFYTASDPNTPTNSVSALTGEWTYITAKFKIPDDAPVGTVNGTIYAQTAPPAGAEGAAAVALSGQVQVAITVGGPAVGQPSGQPSSQWALAIGVLGALIIIAVAYMALRRRGRPA